MSTALAENLWPQPQRALVFTDSVSEPVAVVRPVVSPQSTASPPQWLDPTLRRIQELLTLGRDWDRRGSAAVRTDVLAFAYSMLSQVMGPTTLAPSIVPLGQERRYAGETFSRLRRYRNKRD